MADAEEKAAAALTNAQIATMQQIATAAADGELIDGLLAQGCDRTAVLNTLAAAWQIPVAPAGLLASASPASVPDATREHLARLPAAAVNDPGGGLAVLVTDADAAAAVRAFPLPLHTVFLATAADVRRLSARAPARKAVASPPPDGGWGRTGTEDSLIIDVPTLTRTDVPELTSVGTLSERLQSGSWGDLARVSAVELAQTLLSVRTDAIVDVDIEGMRPAGFAIENGVIVFAVLGRKEGNEAFLELARHRQGRFLLQVDGEPPGRNITMDTDGLLDRASGAVEPTLIIERPPMPRRHEDTAVIDVNKPVSERRGEKVGPYEVLDDLGEGATAVVMRARHGETGEEVALKVLTKESVADPIFLKRFKREIRTHAVLKHTHILGVKDYGRLEGTYYLATEPMEMTLDALTLLGGLPAALVIRVLDHVLRGLAYAHDRGVVHRDLSPASIMLSREGVVKVADFGLARYELDPNKSSTGAILGTPEYMSPEQSVGDDVDARSDLFSLASVGFELLTGEKRFSGQSPAQLLMAVGQADHEPLFDRVPTIPRRLEEVLYKLGQRRREDRFATAHEALAALTPLSAAVRLRHPDLVLDMMRDADAMAKQLRSDQARFEADYGRQLLAHGRDELRSQAGFHAVRALQLDDHNREANQLFHELKDLDPLVNGGPEDPAATDLARRLDGSEADAGRLRRMVKLLLGGGDVLRAAGYLLKLHRLVPDDKKVAAQLDELMGEDPRIPFEWTSRGRESLDAPDPGAFSAAKIAPPPARRSEPSSGVGGWGVVLVAAAVVLVIALIAGTGWNLLQRQDTSNEQITLYGRGLTLVEKDPAEALRSLERCVALAPRSEVGLKCRVEAARRKIASGRAAEGAVELRGVLEVVDEDDPLAAKAKAALAEASKPPPPPSK